ncbi:interferon gamma receptor 1 [Thalassophryne amazonica]|uniref:interferon gamma receptor 1 n=1 Tax=Thalassophryne amazonica TaxID=390379 RepID=UPI001471F402|nr:interferon gamma receptor 1 [Thalassophryne amazonica]
MLFFIFCLLLPAASALIVPPAANVTITCHNFKVTTRWVYSQQQPQTDFSVSLDSSAGRHEAQTHNLHYDLSPFVWESEHYLDFHFVTVTAKHRGQRSEPVHSQTFTYNKLKTAHIKCQLEFPDVRLTVKDSKGLLTFLNPLHFYPELKPKQQLREFSGKVVTDNEEIVGRCSREQMTCRLDVLFRGNSSCVMLKGWILTGNHVGKVMFRNPDQICPQETELVMNVIVLTAMLCIVSVVVTLVAIVICRVRAWTMESPPLPKPLDPGPLDPGHRVLTVQSDTFSNVQISSVPVMTPDFYKDAPQTYEDEYGTAHSAESSCSDLLGSSSDRMLYKDGGLSETSNQTTALMLVGHRTNVDSDIHSDKAEWFYQEEEPQSPYDCSHVL